MNGLPDARICAATADVRHGFVDLGIRRLAGFFDERDGGHDLARLALSALRDLRGNPRLLDRVQRAIRAFQSLNRRD